MNIRDFSIERYFALHEFTVPYQLSASDCEALTVRELLDLAGAPAERLLALSLGYTESRGAPALRRAIAEFYPDCGPDDVLVTNAPEEAIFLSMNSLLSAGDRVVVQTPCYQSLAEIARSLGCEVVPWSLRVDGSGWVADFDDLERALVGARLLVINTPHNPTGYHFTHSDYERVGAIARERGVRVFCDEMYRGLESSPELALPPFASCDPSALSLWGTSKTFGLPGLRIGWLVSRDSALLDRIARLKDYTTICSSAPGEVLAELGLSCFATIAARNRARIAENGRRVRALAARREDRLRWLSPIAGSVGLARVLGESASSLCDRARTQGEILMVPSTVFDLEDSYVRLGLGRAGFAEALERLEAWLAEDELPSV